MDEEQQSPYVTNGYVYTVYNHKKTPLRPRQYATLRTAKTVQELLQNKLPDAGPYQIVSTYAGDSYNLVLQGEGNIEADAKLLQYSIRRFDSDVLHNAGEIYNALTNGYTYPLDEFRSEAGL